MQSNIFLTFALVAFTTARELSPGPQALSDEQSSSLSSQNQGKRYITQEYTLYLTPSEIKALQNVKNSAGLENIQTSQNIQESSQQNNKEQQQQLYSQYRQFIPQEPQAEIRGLVAHHSSLQNQNAENQQQNYQSVNFYPEPKPEQQSKQSSDLRLNDAYEGYRWLKQQEELNQQSSELQSDSQWRPYSPVADKNQEEILLHDQLKQQWNRILDHNRNQLKALTEAEKANQNSQRLNQKEEPTIKSQGESRKEEENKSAIEKEIENILRNNRNIESAKQSAISQSEGNRQTPPIIIHREVSITRHLPVPVVKQVKVPVHTPVLVPVPEPYEVKVPHPYPVPLEIVKHIPVPVIRNH